MQKCLSDVNFASSQWKDSGRRDKKVTLKHLSEHASLDAVVALIRCSNNVMLIYFIDVL